METIIKIQGQLRFVVFESNNGFRICKFQLTKNKKQYITIKGILAQMTNNVNYELTGYIINDNKYGETFVVQSFSLVESNTNEQLVNYFSSSLFPTIGKKTAQIIVDYFQSDILNKIKDNYDSLFTIPNLNPKHAKIIKNVLLENNEDNEIQQIFFANNLSQEILTKLKQKYSMDKIKEFFLTDPYQKLIPLKFGFKQIDKLYLSFNPDKSFSNIRIGYLSWNVVNNLCQQTGSTFTSIEKLYNKIILIEPEIPKNNFLEGLKYIKEQQKLVFKDNKIFDDIVYFSEVNTCNFLLELNNSYKNNNNSNNLQLMENEFYNIEQRKAILNALQENVSIIVGNPGTGKTTVVKGVIDFLKRQIKNVEIALVAPTGKAAKRLREQTNYPASTIHKLLRYDIENDEFYYNLTNPLECDILIIDEASMVDIKLFGAIVAASAKIKKIIFIGDVNQLPSVACGNLFSDIIDSKLFAAIELKTIYRQSSGNDILSLCTAIVNQNDYNFDTSSNDLQFYNLDTADEILQQVLELYKQNLLENKELTFQKLQVIAPMYKGPVGINALNQYLQSNLNFDNKQHNIQVGVINFWLYDKVMQLKNRPELNIYNGDVGIIIQINNDINNNILMLVKFDEYIVEYTKEMAYELTLAYVCSVHKLQGSEYEKVIFVITKSSWPMLYQNLVYTGVSRAKKQLFLIGEKYAFNMAINKKNVRRETMLLNFLLQEHDKI